MSKEIKIEINIDGKSLFSYNKIVIHQQFNAHHTFEVLVDQDALEETGSHTIQNSQEYIGKFLTVCFGNRDAGENVFKGIITEVMLQHDQGLWGSLILKGYSPTYLMEAGSHHTSYYKSNLKEIMTEAAKNLAANDMHIYNKPTHTSEIAYICQYGESHFQFVNRLATEYGEWFFYDGHTLFFGKPSELNKVTLVYGEDIESMNFSMRVVPSNVNHYSYNSKNNEVITCMLPDSVDGANLYTQKALDVSKKLFRNPVAQPVAIRTSSKDDLDRYAKNHKAKFAANTVHLNGQGDNAKVKLGTLIEVKVSQKGIGSGENDHGEYLVVGLTHHISGTGTYTNSFEAIPSANQYMPFRIPPPVAETQMATVKHNNDPDGAGRVRVQMLWQESEGLLTDWIRVLTPDGGSSDKVGKNRGFVFIPEVGDQVIVAFRYNDPNRPFVLGSMFHGKTGGGGSNDNHSKSLTTRTGSTIMLNDDAHTVTMQTSNGNTIKVDEKSGAVSITSGSSVSISSKSISITGSESVSIQSPSITIGSLGGEKPTDTVTMEGKAVTITGEDTLDASGKVTSVKGGDKLNAGGKEIIINAETKMTLTAGSQLKASSGDSEFI